MQNKKLGYLGEKIVTEYLLKKGYEIIENNYCIRGGEIDIIAKYDGFLAFVEVKTRKLGSLTSGLEAVTLKKQKLVIRTAECFIYKNKIVDLQPRFDVAEVIVDENIVPQINYIENAYIKN